MYQAEIDAACELADFWRFNTHFARRLYAEQPLASSSGVWNRLDHRPLEGFIYAITPFNFTAIAGNLPTAPALMGNPVLWKPSPTQALAADWRIVGETGGKDFVLAHPSADVGVLRTALLRGAFEYSGQKCSAASRAYIPASVWARLKDSLADVTASLPVGPVTDFSMFTSAVIDERAFRRHRAALERSAGADGVQMLAGGGTDDRRGWFVEPTVMTVTDPLDEALTTEYFGPTLAVHVFADADYDRVVSGINDDSKYALTGSIIAADREAVARASTELRFAAGNFYINDKPSGAVVGQQPFGGGRASGTNDKAGSAQNLGRWTSTRTIKETFDPPTDHAYPHMG